MDQVSTRKWIEALRSGKYRQTRQSLKDDSGYCCLGVLCRIVEPKTSPTRWDNGCQEPIGRIRRKVGIDSTAVNRLIIMNDLTYQSFASIANWIEEHL